MTKRQVIRHLAEQLQVPPKQVAGFLGLLIETATSQTRAQSEFTIPGLGKLVNAERAARTGRNSVTGEPIKIAAKTTLKSGCPSRPRTRSCRPRRSQVRRKSSILARLYYV